MARKARRRTKNDFDMDFMGVENILAINEGPKKKSWSVQDIKPIKPLTDSQSAFMESFFTGNHIVADGSAGTGKSYIALWLALNTILSKESPQKKIIIVRSNVSTGKDVGALPGELEDKMAPYEAPYKDILHDLLGKFSSYDDMKEAKKIDFMPVAYIRGLSWDDAVVIIDEAQNMDDQTLHSVMTRIGRNTRVIVCGDRAQNDLINERKMTSGFDNMIRTFENMRGVDIIRFTKHDIVRSGFVKSWIIAREDLGL